MQGVKIERTAQELIEEAVFDEKLREKGINPEELRRKIEE